MVSQLHQTFPRYGTTVTCVSISFAVDLLLSFLFCFSFWCVCVVRGGGGGLSAADLLCALRGCFLFSACFLSLSPIVTYEIRFFTPLPLSRSHPLHACSSLYL